MRSDNGWAKIIVMTEAHPDRVTIEFEAGEPIQGRLTVGTAAAHPFHGWLELCAEIERAWKELQPGAAYTKTER